MINYSNSNYSESEYSTGVSLSRLQHSRSVGRDSLFDIFKIEEGGREG